MNNVPRETQERLDAFVALLTRWNKMLNLVSRGDLGAELHGRHIAEALALIPHLPIGISRFIDLGSGGGLPAIPLAIATGLHVDLVESDQRKAAFLETALGSLDLKGTVWNQRAELCTAPPAGCLTARALTALPRLLAYSHNLLTNDGIALFLKGDRAQTEVDEARLVWQMQAEMIPLDRSDTRILKISRLQRRK